MLLLRRSVLTEKIARRGLHLTREYSIDPLEVLFVADVMSRGRPLQPGATPPPAVYSDDTLRHVAYLMAESRHTELPVLQRSDPGQVLGSVSLQQLLEGRLRDLHEDRHSERVLRPMQLIGLGRDNGTARQETMN